MAGNLDSVFFTKYNEFCEELKEAFPERKDKITFAKTLTNESKLARFKAEVLPTVTPNRDLEKCPGAVLPGVTIPDSAQTQAKVITTDVAASNGVIHAIDKVLVPPGVLKIVQMAQVNPLFTTLVSSVVKANLQSTLSGAGPFTVFAPTNDAFAAIQSTVAGLTTAQLIKVLTYHVLPAQVLAANIPFGTPVATVEGETLTINSGTPPTITDKTSTNASIVITDVRASNGVIHVINKVLIPTL
jgi:transforming growth factor-beta-induced protein